MIKPLFLVLLFSTMSMFFQGCLYTEIGKPGPQGPEGEQGGRGIPGPPGEQGPSQSTRNVYYSTFKDYSSTMIENGSHDFYETIDVPELTKNILDSVLVLVFMNRNGNRVKLPYTGATGSGQIIFYTVKPETIIIHANYDISKNIQFRYIIIPLENGIDIARKTNAEDKDYYNYICNYYNIPK